MKASPSLQHTRVASLRNLCLLCAILRELGGTVRQRELMLEGKALGLPGFEAVMSTGALPTRVRHHDYALRELELIDTAKNSPYLLTTKGEKLAELTKRYDVEPVGTEIAEADINLPEPIRAELREILCSSRYVKYWWLRYFMPRDNFPLQEFASEGRDVIIERVPPEQYLSQHPKTGKQFNDSGYRVHSYFLGRETLLLDGAGRREIHQGLRQWSIRVDLVNEVTGWDTIFEIEDEFSRRLEQGYVRLDRVYVVQRHWGADTPIAEFEAVLSELRKQLGGVNRIHIPELVMMLALQEGISLQGIRELLPRLYQERPSRYFFESASKWLLEQPSNPFSLESYVQIDGTWRTSLVFTA
jgi:hypothetical protein